MTDRYNALVVALEHDIRSDDAEDLIKAIKRFRGVVEVKGNVSAIDTYVAQQRAHSYLWAGVVDVFYPERKNR